MRVVILVLPLCSWATNLRQHQSPVTTPTLDVCISDENGKLLFVNPFKTSTGVTLDSIANAAAQLDNMYAEKTKVRYEDDNFTTKVSQLFKKKEEVKEQLPNENCHNEKLTLDFGAFVIEAFKAKEGFTTNIPKIVFGTTYEPQGGWYLRNSGNYSIN
jgi:hypothetical protein